MSKKNNKKKQNLNSEEILEDIVVEEDTSMNSRVSKLKKKIKDLEENKKDYLDGWQRAKADMINLKKEHEKQKKVFTDLGKESLLLDIIPILDNFEAAFSDKTWSEMPENWKVGIEYIQQQFLQVLDVNGVNIFGQKGDNFNVAIHHCMENENVDNTSEDGKITSVIQKGYMLKDRVVREAKVKVGQYKK